MAKREAEETTEMEAEEHSPEFLEKAAKHSKRKVHGKRGARLKGHGKKHSRKRATSKR
ncbi:MAG TPA: hypothetical protein VFW94_24330 [Candidatus Acidoferrales bacterium]|nr:hypothetical protein [Candidatus Acidoferrales bacterium]